MYLRQDAASGRMRRTGRFARQGRISSANGVAGAPLPCRGAVHLRYENGTAPAREPFPERRQPSAAGIPAPHGFSQCTLTHRVRRTAMPW
jgi:hypothetical protein